MSYFEKVSRKQFIADSLKILTVQDENTIDTLNQLYNEIQLPKRGTERSAGYDFYFPYKQTALLSGGGMELIPTGIRWVVTEGEPKAVLLILPRSSIGFKTGATLANTMAVIDADYCRANNEGHIMIKMVGGFKDLVLNQNDRFVQGIITNFQIVDNDETVAKRSGGIGSTGA